MDTLSKETMGLPIFISPNTHRIISSGDDPHRLKNPTTAYPPTRPPSTSNNPSPTSSFFPASSFFSNAQINTNATHQNAFPASPSTHSTVSKNKTTAEDAEAEAEAEAEDTETCIIATSSTASAPTPRDARRNTYTPPTFSPRRESLISAKRLSRAFDLASSAFDSVWRAAENILGEEGTGQGQQRWDWSADLESGVDGDVGEWSVGGSVGDGGGKAVMRRFGEGDVLGEWLD